jgi:hypothetical protein
VLDQKLRRDMAKVIAHPPNLQRGQPTTPLPNMKYPHMGPQMIDQVLDQGSLGTESYHPIPCRARPTLPSFVPFASGSDETGGPKDHWVSGLCK